LSLKDPYQDIEFSVRHALILDKDGTPIYENDVTFPTYFSDNAVNIVSSKYFYSSDDRKETDIRQMFDRVSDTLTDWGVKQKYFGKKDSNKSKEFNYRLKKYQIQQLFAFNSPVYFNVGNTDKVQASACFIIDVQDDMESIANVCVVESKIFKNGSGSGMNISNIRSKYEHVGNTRGYASGPISFLKVHDVLANVIRSGGSLRRSAKLVCLDIQHPDIEEFIDCKKFEDEKIKALINGDIESRKGCELSDEVFFQNTNISVRIPDKFMKKVLDNDTWDTKFVTDDKTYKTYLAQDLLVRIAERAWECADPGLQFSDSINNWNTCSNDGEIRSSNPCLPIWAPVLTPDGYKRFGEIKNKILYKGQKECSDVIETSKLEKVYELELKNGMCLYSTKNHLVKTYRGDIKVEDLKVNDLIEVNYEKVNYTHNDDEFEKGFISGYLYSDGSLYYSNSKNNICANFSLGIAEFDLEEDLLTILKKHIVGFNKDFSPHNQKPDTCLVLPITKNESIKSLINIFGANSKDEFDLFQHSLSFQKGFIEAFITFDGHVLDYRYNKVIRATQSGDRGLGILKQIQLSLASFGIYCNLTISNHEKYVERNGKVYHHQTVYNLLINDVWEFNKEFKIYSPIKNNVIEQIVSIPKKHPTRLSTLKEYQFIKNLTEFSEETVYDINVPEGNHFVSSGITVHNCGEFFWLDHSSCNLASINLLKFVKCDPETNEYTFDFELFEDVVTIVITAQDIIVDKAVYPTEEITTNTKSYRPLGLGYTNLGAMLMYLGLPYDSDAGRSIVSHITAILTGTAFITSHKLSKIKESFKHFENNKESYYNVLKKHNSEVLKIKKVVENDVIYSSYNKFSESLSKMSGKIWEAIMELVKQEETFRNAQVTLMAPTGCVVSESMILSDQGILEIGYLLPNTVTLTEDIVPEDLKWHDHNINILQETTTQNSNKFYYNGFNDTIKIITEDGYELEGTGIHKVRVLEANGDYIWKELKNIRRDDQVCIKIGGHESLLENKEYIKLQVSNNHNCTNLEIIDVLLKEELAYLLGYYMGNGNTHKDGIRFAVGNDHIDVSNILDHCLKKSFNIGITTSFKGIGDSTTFCINNRNLVDFFKINSFEKDKGNHGEGAESAFIPVQILMSKTSVLCAFLEGLFDSDGTINGKKNCPIIEYSSVSKKLVKQMQTCLTYLGIMTSIDKIIPKSGFSEDRRDLWRLRIKSGYYAKVFEYKIGFLCEKKKAKLNFTLKNIRGATIYGRDVWEDFRNHLPNGLGYKIRANFSVRVFQEQGSLFWAQQMIDKYPSLGNSKIGEFIQLGLNTSRVNETISSKNQTFDISVPINNTYIVNNIVSHNTISFLMDAQTTGVEPEFSHVKYKRLSNTDGSILTTISPLTRTCLENLKYDRDKINEIEYYIKENKPLNKCKSIDKSHTSIFDVSSCSHEDQLISYTGHIKMLAAIQPFISGGISKTINLPNNATVEDVFKCYLECWKMGLKGVTVYRDGSKNYQPLSNKEDDENINRELELPEIMTLEDMKQNERLIKHLHAKLAERKLPPERPAMIYKFNVGGVKGFLTCGLYDDGDLGEIFINISKEGSTLSGLLDCLATAVSISLQSGVPLKDFVEKMIWQKFEPYGFTTDKDIKTATSLVDFIFKYLGMKFLNKNDQIELGLITQEDVSINKQSESFEEVDINNEEVKNDFNNRSLLNTFAGPSCNNCGSIMIKKGNCFLCMNCGSNNGACG